MHPTTRPLRAVSTIWCALALLLAVCSVLTGLSAYAFDFAGVAQRARVLSQSTYKKLASNLPKTVDGLSYDQYRDIGFDTDKALWRSAKLPYEVAFFHQGLFYDHPVKINEVMHNKVREIKFDPKSFNYGKNAIDSMQLAQLGFAGCRAGPPCCAGFYCAGAGCRCADTAASPPAAARSAGVVAVASGCMERTTRASAMA